MSRDYTVHYPSGRTFSVSGTVRLLDADDHGIFALIDCGAEDMVLDPRAVVVCDGTVVVEPRQHPSAQLAAWVRAWLAEHPEWPRIVTEQPPR